ncbi:hypothetical protein QWM81_20185 [Streptomyces ficellus]|uniref:2-dehydro-3-deoxy-phosphogluconate aldolase n=1 Tax=Streptomyces ficellus TaxID=1977088 RepID=A0ABT7ZA59_9ACTN|nr:hypothetical protein [Streptomyces ficellus]MDN3296341.1 hypothetical protein [Streptomyces ficellus]
MPVVVLEDAADAVPLARALVAGGLPAIQVTLRTPAALGVTSLAGPLPRARFCPTGGISAASAPAHLALPNVGCVRGTWMLPADAPAREASCLTG